MIGRYRSDDDSVAGFSFLASDREDEEEETRQVTMPAVKKKRSSGKEIQTHVFTWGLNDKDQLGGPKGSKVGWCLDKQTDRQTYYWRLIHIKKLI